MEDWKMDNLKSALTLIGVGATIGAVIVVILIYAVGATPSGIQIGPIQFNLPPSRSTTALPPSAVIVDESVVDVLATKYWGDTGIKVQRGDWIEFSASGSWWSGISKTGPDGDGGIPPFGWARPSCGQCPVPDGNLGELVGKVDDGVPFRIGRLALLSIDRSGNIILAMNETTGPCKDGRPGSCYDDNTGALKVKVTVRRIR